MPELEYPSTDMYEATPISGSLKLHRTNEIDHNNSNIKIKEGYSNRNLPINTQLSEDRDKNGNNQNLFINPKNPVNQKQ